MLFGTPPHCKRCTCGTYSATSPLWVRTRKHSKERSEPARAPRIHYRCTAARVELRGAGNPTAFERGACHREKSTRAEVRVRIARSGRSSARIGRQWGRGGRRTGARLRARREGRLVGYGEVFDGKRHAGEQGGLDGRASIYSQETARIVLHSKRSLFVETRDSSMYAVI